MRLAVTTWLGKFCRLKPAPHARWAAGWRTGPLVGAAFSAPGLFVGDSHGGRQSDHSSWLWLAPWGTGVGQAEPQCAKLGMPCYFPDTVMMEGTHLSKGRGTTRPLEIVLAPDFPMPCIVQAMHRLAPAWLHGCIIPPYFFEPTFHKHVGQCCQGVPLHVALSSSATSSNPSAS